MTGDLTLKDVLNLSSGRQTTHSLQLQARFSWREREVGNQKRLTEQVGWEPDGVGEQRAI